MCDRGVPTLEPSASVHICVSTLSPSKTHFCIRQTRQRWAQACSRQEKKRIKILTLAGRDKHTLHAHQKHTWLKIQSDKWEVLLLQREKYSFWHIQLYSPLKSFSWGNYTETNEPFQTSLSLCFCGWMWKALTLLFQQWLLNRLCIFILTSFPVASSCKRASMCTNWNPVITSV